MGHWKDKYVIGLTGNIATGKSLVRRMLEYLGAYAIDADGLTHRVMAKGAPAYQPIVETFGRFVVTPEGEINRERLAAIVFSHPEALRTLEALTHPAIREAINLFITRASQKVVVVEAIKLLETGLANEMDAVWVVDSPPQLQLERLKTQRNLPEQDALRRINAQNPQADKIAHASLVIKNTGTPDQVWAQVQAAWGQISVGAEASQAAQQVVSTVQVPTAAPTPPAAPPPAPPTAQAEATPTPPAQPAVVVEPVTSIDFKRPRPSDFGKIAALITQETGQTLTDSDIIASFGQKSYLLAEGGGQAVGIIAFSVENLVTRVDEFVISRNAPLDVVGGGLVDAMEKASQELNSEIVFIFLPEDAANQKDIFIKQGYESTTPNEVRYPAWREAVDEFSTSNKTLLSKRLRENLILKPI